MHYQQSKTDIVTAFATTNRGLEQLLVTELESFGVTNTHITNAGVKFSTNYPTIMKLNLYSRYSSRILIEVVNGKYVIEQDIYDMCYAINWNSYFSVNNAIKVKTSAIHCPLKSLNFITLKVKDAICDKFVTTDNLRPDVNKSFPDIQIYTFLTNDHATIYIDTSGEGLFKRGYRQNKLEAPLKENLASGLVAFSNWDSNTPLIDPMCGSGTIIIEALGIALNIAPGLNRDFAFEKIKLFDHKLWNSIRQDAIKHITLNSNVQLFANDISFIAIKIAKENLQFFKQQLLELLPNKQDVINKLFDNCVIFSMKNFLDLNAPTSSGVLITNLPYGVRMEELDNLAKLYPQMAKHLKNNYANWNTYFLTSDLQMPKLMRLKPSRKIPVFNGPLECRLFEIKMVAGSNRE